jgi:two-component SAPR family response regulator
LLSLILEFGAAVITISSIKPLIVSIDDETNILKLVQMLLGSQYQVMVFSEADKAVKALGSLRPDLIICDITMPSMDGFELHALLREHETLRGVPFIYLTALGEREMVRKGMLQGADDYLVKPFTADELKEAVQTRLERTRTLRVQPPTQSDTWTIYSLGGVGIEADGRLREFSENKKVLELFLYLASNGNKVSHGDVLRDLWWEPVEAVTLHVLLNRARKTFDGLADIASRLETVTLNVLRPYLWDAEIFERLAKDALSSHDETAIERALQQSKGSFLMDFFSPWSEEQRDHFEGLYVKLLEAAVTVASTETFRKNAQQRLQAYLGINTKDEK